MTTPSPPQHTPANAPDDSRPAPGAVVTGVHASEFAAPPTRPGALGMPKRKVTWPVGVGVVMLTVSILSAMYYVYDFMLSLYAQRMGDATGGGGASAFGQMSAAMTEWQKPALGAAVAGLGLAALAIVASARLLLRRPDCVWLFRMWAVAKMIQGVAFAVVTGVVQFSVTRGAMSGVANAQGPGGRPAVPANVLTSISSAMMVMIVLAMIAVTCALPIFALFWFSRRSVRAEVATWPR